MNTTKAHAIPRIKENRSRDYEFVLEDYELAFRKDQLEEITDMWNNGAELEFIAKKHKRMPEEVFLALFHQSIKNKVTRAFAYRK